MPEALIVGSGVIGFTTAITLQEAGFRSRIVTRALPDNTTSAVAGAVWYPYKAYPEDQVLRWSRQSYDIFRKLATVPDSGVFFTPLLELFDKPRPDPWWKPAVPAFRRALADELRLNYVDGYVAEVPMIETPVYLGYLRRRFEARGGTIEVVREGVADLAGLCRRDRIVVNCTGLGARALVPDDTVYPIRGQVVRVTNPGLEGCLIDDYGPLAMTYVLPRRHDCILGGTTDEHVWDQTPDEATTQAILSRASRLEPRLCSAEVLDVCVGLRPARPSVRVDLEPLGSDRAVIHNYGHGGAGFTLSWGCAGDVLALARARVSM